MACMPTTGVPEGAPPGPRLDPFNRRALGLGAVFGGCLAYASFRSPLSRAEASYPSVCSKVKQTRAAAAGAVSSRAMKLFLDTGDVAEVQKAAEWGILDGVTTNPTLIAKAGKGFRETVLRICELVPGGAISAEVVATDYDTMLKEALEIASWHEQIVVKVPLIEPGVRLVSTLTERGIRTNVTLVFSVTQALLVAKAGATYISNFVGRVDDVSGDGMAAVAATVEMVESYGFDSEVLVASVRHPQHVVQALACRAHVATMPYSVIAQLAKHPLTDIGLKRFMDDWNAAGLSIFEPAVAR
jgi:transaldolase